MKELEDFYLSSACTVILWKLGIEVLLDSPCILTKELHISVQKKRKDERSLLIMFLNLDDAVGLICHQLLT